MLVGNFKENFQEYKDFQIWDVNNIDEFINGNAVIKEIVKKEFKVNEDKINEFKNKKITSHIPLIEDTLDLVNDKYFLVFEKSDQNHNDLIYLQATNVMNFGVDIKEIDSGHVYIMIMEKSKKSFM